MDHLDADRLLVQGQFGPDYSLLTRSRVSQQLDQAGGYGMNLLAVKTDGPHTSYTSHAQSWYMSRIVESTMGSCLQPVLPTLYLTLRAETQASYWLNLDLNARTFHVLSFFPSASGERR
ncbi:hypothetical protein COCCADRAFT_38314 [Bipolaris zeicola 26-R-13]|uniref:Uncharacterized protein n=1 Tax=Cochliobolus carbonum (strain 26-R-13) TaxID=930089 RepID=W6Y1X3_COCC2|nr:uncharacterized protein COCCADRAFT_38314 [Bipolaris zeicola 26-R-13]EUC31635.1 hypothetical protein COCCADRAFT_38314 [Bipolaris zeicola 26-R-13]